MTNSSSSSPSTNPSPGPSPPSSWVSPSVVLQLLPRPDGGVSSPSNQSGAPYKVLEGADVQRVGAGGEGGGDESHVVTVLLFAVGIVAFVFVVVCVVSPISYATVSGVARGGGRGRMSPPVRRKLLNL